MHRWFKIYGKIKFISLKPRYVRSKKAATCWFRDFDQQTL